MGDGKNHDFVTGNVTGQTPRQLSAEFAVCRELRPDVKRPVWHTSLALPAGERLTGERWQTVVDDFMDGMGFDRDNHQFFAVRHNDTQHDHVHIIASRIGLDGSLWHGKWEAVQAINLVQKIEQKHGLIQTAGLKTYQDDDDVTRIDRKGEKSLTRHELYMAAKTGVEPPRRVLQRLVKEAVKHRPTATQFAERLVAAGVGVRANISSKVGKMSGFSFEFKGIPFTGRQLGREFVWDALQEQGVSYDITRDRKSLERIAGSKRASPADQHGSGIAARRDSDQQGNGNVGRSDYGSTRENGRRTKYSGSADPKGRGGNLESSSGGPESEHIGANEPELVVRKRNDHISPSELSSYVSDLANRNAMTPEKARKDIDLAIEKNPAPMFGVTKYAVDQLEHWFEALSCSWQLAEAIQVANDYFTKRTHDEAAQNGWQGDQMTEAGLSGPLVDASQKPPETLESASEPAQMTTADYFTKRTHDEAAQNGWQGDQMTEAGLSGPLVNASQKPPETLESASEPAPAQLTTADHQRAWDIEHGQQPDDLDNLDDLDDLDDQDSDLPSGPGAG
jgi:hypothetical protein